MENTPNPLIHDHFLIQMAIWREYDFQTPPWWAWNNGEPIEQLDGVNRLKGQQLKWLNLNLPGISRSVKFWIGLLPVPLTCPTILQWSLARLAVQSWERGAGNFALPKLPSVSTVAEKEVAHESGGRRFWCKTCSIFMSFLLFCRAAPKSYACCQSFFR